MKRDVSKVTDRCVQVSDYPLMTLEPDDRGTFIAVGSQNGNTTILELSHHLIDLQKNEKNIFLSVRIRLQTSRTACAGR